MDLDLEALKELHEQAQAAARKAADRFFKERLGGKDQFACGFAWVNVPVKASTKLGRKLASLGFRRSYRGGLDLWNPSGYPCQNIDTLEAGADAYAQVFESVGIPCSAQSRLD
jgi:hypothetical protein